MDEEKCEKIQEIKDSYDNKDTGKQIVRLIDDFGVHKFHVDFWHFLYHELDMLCYDTNEMYIQVIRFYHLLKQ